MVIQRFIAISILVVFIAGCTKEQGVIDPVPDDTFPQLDAIRLSSYQFDTDTMNVQSGSRSPEDPVGFDLGVQVRFRNSPKAGVQNVRCAVVREEDSKVVLQAPLPDLLESEPPWFGGTLTLHMKRGDVGNYRVEATGNDTRGASLNLVRTTFTLISGKNPPVLGELTAPDTLEVPTQGSLVFTLVVKATDPSGPKDIKHVWFNTWLPTGKPSSQNPFIMYDDGTHGDAVAGDSYYSLTVQLPSSTERGTYKFEFTAYDYGNLASNVITHFIHVR